MAKRPSSPAAAFPNPYRPGAGHPPPFLAGRDVETGDFRKLLGQSLVSQNLVLTGLRGVGKTVLLDTAFKALALDHGWLWAGTDLSESTTVSEATLAIRILTDLAVVTSDITVDTRPVMEGFGFSVRQKQASTRLSYDALVQSFERTPGLAADKLKLVLHLAARGVAAEGGRGLVFAYDEAQNLADHATKEQYPLSLLLDVFQSVQKAGVPCMLVLTGLPTLFPKLVEARTFSERMFRVIFLDRLNERDSRAAITRPIEDSGSPIQLSRETVRLIVEESGGYPYFIQFICREVYDAFLHRLRRGRKPAVPMADITRKLDTDFFAGRWHKATDRQREILWVIASLVGLNDEFTVQEVVETSQQLLRKPFSSSHANQMLAALGNAGLVYKNRHGRYSFAVPLLGPFILRTHRE